MLYSLLFVSAQLGQSCGHQGIDTTDCLKPATFLARAGQTLVAGKFRSARTYSVEAVLLYAQCQFYYRGGQDAQAWVSMGVCTRLAMKMGYHRDPRHLAGISPFDGEMRRRTFHLIGMFDLLLSFQAGLPPNMHEEECDVEPIRNLFDEDFDEDCKVLPPSRPSTEPTPMLLWCWKANFSKLLARVIRHALSLKEPRYEDTLDLDRQLREMHAEIPPSLLMKPLSSSFTDSVPTIVSRLNVQLLYLKSLCVLHRSHLSRGRSNPAYGYSRKTCTSAASQILSYQAELYLASQPGRRYHNDGSMISSVALHDYLLAAMITCLDLYESSKESTPPSEEELKIRVEQYNAVRLAREIWTSRMEKSKDASRASRILAAMLSRIPYPSRTPATKTSNVHVSEAPQISANEDINGNGVYNPSWTAPEYATAPVAVDQAVIEGDVAPLTSDVADPLHSIFNQPDNFDWVSSRHNCVSSVK